MHDDNKPRKKRRSGHIASTVAPSLVFASTSKKQTENETQNETQNETENEGDTEPAYSVFHWISTHSKNDELRALAMERRPVVVSQ